MPGSPSSTPWDERPATSLTISALLAVIGGFLDGFTYVGHGHVFANAMTGNVVLLGIFGIAGSRQQSFRHLPPILTFMLGVCAARAMLMPKMRRCIPFPYLSVVAVESLIIGVIALLPDSTPDFCITTSIAFAGSMQVETFRVVDGHNFNSTFTTGNLRSLCEGLFDWIFRNDIKDATSKTGDFAAICLAFLVGAALGCFSVSRLGNRALVVVFILLVAVFVRLWTHRALPTSALAKPQPGAQHSDS